ncbi:hypothetical protein STCU_02818 [Strigomonas culicis]|uniref:Uncharacterized protein n=1 Tax=Strigomonas culicis TaxID=28005 RepID=S9UUD1_9TRYP|nr:hypothetical protein STCU_02818 [Strigomonas culicis]|eukprot:EPY32424.1 hypothetical protein STCU_02818 [Strigomonas culicis]
MRASAEGKTHMPIYRFASYFLSLLLSSHLEELIIRLLTLIIVITHLYHQLLVYHQKTVFTPPCKEQKATMFLTYQFAPVWILSISLLTYLVLTFLDPVDLTQYKKSMHGYSPAICILSMILPFAVAFLYEFAMFIGPKPSKAGLKV